MLDKADSLHFGMVAIKARQTRSVEKNMKGKGSACTCDQCDPYAYQYEEFICEHADIVLPKPQELNRYGYRTVPPPTLEGLRKYEALHVARKAIEYFDKPVERMNEKQLNAIDRLRKAYAKWIDRKDAKKGLREEDAYVFLYAFNDLFFFGAMRRFIFKWTNKMQRSIVAWCECNWWNGTARITAHRRRWNNFGAKPTRSHSRKRHRFGTLLHEALHGFLGMLSCGACDFEPCALYNLNIGNDGHGRAWMLLATKMEEALLRIMGLKIYLGRGLSLDNNIRVCGKRPSAHDFEAYGLLKHKTSRLLKEHRIGKSWKPRYWMHCVRRRTDGSPKHTFNLISHVIYKAGVSLRYTRDSRIKLVEGYRLRHRG